MKVRFIKPSNWDRLGQKYLAEAKRHVVTKAVRAVEAMQKSILQTPVYTGKTLINYHWSVGTPVEMIRRPVLNPRLPGQTSDLPLGSEPRRQAQEVVVEYEFSRVVDAIRADPFRHFYLTNTAPGFLAVEYGSYRPDARTPPGGMTRRGESLISVILGGPHG